MRRALAGHQSVLVRAAGGVSFVDIDADTGKLAGAWLPARHHRGLPRRAPSRRKCATFMRF